MNQCVVVTGAAGGIGCAIVDAFLGEGWRVVAIDREIPNNENRPALRWIQANLMRVSDLAAISSSIRDGEGVIHCLVNNAAEQHCALLAQTATEIWDRVMAVNLRAPFVLARDLSSLMPDNMGSIVNISSVHARATAPYLGAYAVSKSGVEALTRTLALELGKRGIRANTVLPGAVDTPMLASGFERGGRESSGTGFASSLRALAERTPINRVGAPRDIAEAVLFLADTSRSGFMSGHGLVVDGGVLSQLSSERLGG